MQSAAQYLYFCYHGLHLYAVIVNCVLNWTLYLSVAAKAHIVSLVL